MKYRVGCSGWSYKHWRDDFYPHGLAASRWLEHYASVFDTVELNGTFYRLPSEDTFRAWRDRAPQGFCFSAKVSRLITHFRRLRNCESALELYLRRVRFLGEKLGPLLYQLPPSLERDIGVLEAFLDLLPTDLNHVFEFRHDSWWTNEVFELLRSRGASFCAFDMGRTRTPLIAISPVFYMRFHGPDATYGSAYSDAALESASRAISGLDGITQSWLYFNNDIGGYAPRNALRLRQLLGCD